VPGGHAGRVRGALKQLRVWLVRHAAPVTPGGITVGAGDPLLSEAGVAQARRIAASLAERPLTKVWSSDLRRAVDTAAMIAALHGLTVETTTALRELDFGAWEGRDLRDMWLEDPLAARAWEADIADAPRSFGESVRDLETRVRDFWHGVVLSGEAVVVAHRGSLAALQAAITGQRFAECFRDSAAWVEAQVTDRRPGRSASR
jgi:broad specificity phosphatase PhoE